jgi:hypothetical protein
LTERVVMAASALKIGIGSSAHVWHATPAGESRFRLRSTAHDKASYSSCECKVKASRHRQFGASIAARVRKGKH